MGQGHAALRSGRCSVAGQVYLITFTTRRRRRHFSEWQVAAQAAALLASPESWRGAHLLAWVLMPDHWHGLVQLQEPGLSTAVGRCKGRSARMLREQHPQLGRIWSAGFHDHALRRDEDLLRVARYIVMNPVRAELARRAGQYPYWDAAWL